MKPTFSESAPTAAEADAEAARNFGLPQAITVIDRSRLSELLEREVTITHARVKPGHSVVVAHHDHSGHHGWTMLTLDADKLSKAQERAADIGDPLTIHQQAAGLYAFSGSIWSDPFLAKELAEAVQAVQQRSGPSATWHVLKFNPRRRVVASVEAESGTKVIRVLPGDAAPLLRTCQHWRELGLPVPRTAPLGQRGSAVIAPLWGSGDLSSMPYEPAAVSAGSAISQLHSSAARGTRTVENPDPLRAAAALSRLAPWLKDRAEHLARQCAGRLTPMLNSAPAEIHGDLSPDQVVLASEHSHKIRLIDLERAGGGHPLQDIGSWVASCRHTANTNLIDAFFDGYGPQPAFYPADLGTWEAYAHLNRATDFFRRREADWPAQTLNALNLAEEALLQ